MGAPGPVLQHSTILQRQHGATYQLQSHAPPASSKQPTIAKRTFVMSTLAVARSMQKPAKLYLSIERMAGFRVVPWLGCLQA